MVWKQDSKYDNCFSFHSLSDSLEVAKQTLIDEVVMVMCHMSPGFVGEDKNKRIMIIRMVMGINRLVNIQSLT